MATQAILPPPQWRLLVWSLRVSRKSGGFKICQRVLVTKSTGGSFWAVTVIFPKTRQFLNNS
jgi:hypothetical protein